MTRHLFIGLTALLQGASALIRDRVNGSFVNLLGGGIILSARGVWS
ncbi:hypothetical protein [Hyphomonas sp.]